MTVLGELLGQQNQATLMEAYVLKLDLRGLNLEQALRALLSGFRLPGEAQKIDRILDVFARHWHSSSQDEGSRAQNLTADGAFVLVSVRKLSRTNR